MVLDERIQMNPYKVRNYNSNMIQRIVSFDPLRSMNIYELFNSEICNFEQVLIQ